MKTNVNFSKVQYVVKPKEGVVVCTMRVDPNLDKLYKMKLDFDSKWFKSLPIVDTWGAFTAKGVAKCSKEDTFNEILGKRIAEAKAKKMAFGICSTIHKIIFSKLTANMTEYAEIARGCGRACTTEKEHLDYLLDEADKKEE